MKVLRTLLIYILLIGGSLLFIWPFLWMAATSAKLDREMFGERMQMWPQRPLPRLQSPYVDERLFADLEGPRLDESVAMIRQRLASLDYPWPNDVDRDLLLQQTARGIYQRLLTVLPAEFWELPAEELHAKITAQISPEIIAGVVRQLRRAFCLGAMRAQSYEQQEDILISGGRAATGWKVGGSAGAQLTEAGTSAEPHAVLQYDFNRGDTVTLTQTFRTSFPLARLHRLQLSLRYDDTWHKLRMFVEKEGRRYEAARALPLADYEWVLDTWQEPGPDDRPTKVKTWTLLEPAGRSGTASPATTAPNEIKITLELQRTSQLGAWWSKIARNYRLTFDLIPFWRYVGTSLFLVILNVIGTLFSCSLVAYAFARLQWPGRSFCFALLLATMMIPPQVTMIPQFLIMQKLGWYNTLKPLWIASFFAPAFYVFLLRQFLKGVPRDLEDAARLDGCGFFRIYWHIMLPLVKPTLAAIGIFTFLATWNEFMAPLIYLADQRLYPLSFGLYAFSVFVTNPGTAKGMGMVMAASLLMTLPVIVIFFFAQRYFLRGVTLTGMKG
ncbi:MAG: ABC transporter permease subunit [Verrucomicrobiota bacterium]|nr:ABC transporter permease subunit [Verrucomicrobiota bacterium]